MTTNRSTTEIGNTPRIYVASLSDYNAGRLHGRWIDANQPAETIREEISQMLAESKEPSAEEWAIHDYENFAGYNVGEFADLEQLSEIASLILEHGPVFGRLLTHFGGDLEDAKRYMNDGYRGEWDSLAHYVESLVEECYSDVLKALPNFIRGHIDFEGIGDDMELSGDVFTIDVDRKIHVFDSCI